MCGTIEVDGGEIRYRTGIAVDRAYLFESSWAAQEFYWKDGSEPVAVWLDRMLRIPEHFDIE